MVETLVFIYNLPQPELWDKSQKFPTYFNGLNLNWVIIYQV